jgi:adenylate cyclase
MAKALEIAKKAVSLDGADAHALLGWLYAMTKQHDRAIAECQKAVWLDPNNATAYTFYGVVMNSVGRPDEAIHALETAVRIDPFSTSFQLRTLGFAYSLRGMHEKAVTTCRKAVTKSPHDLLSHIFLTYAYSEADRMEEAKQEAGEVLRINPKFSLETFANQLIVKDQAEKNKIITSLQKAGLPPS